MERVVAAVAVAVVIVFDICFLDVVEQELQLAVPVALALVGTHVPSTAPLPAALK